MASNNLSSTLVGSGLGGGVSDGESSSTGTAGGGFGLNPNMLERQGSIQGRERMIAHSTALESITAEVDSMSIGNAPYNTTTGNTVMPGNITSQVHCKFFCPRACEVTELITIISALLILKIHSCFINNDVIHLMT